MAGCGGGSKGVRAFGEDVYLNWDFRRPVHAEDSQHCFGMIIVIGDKQKGGASGNSVSGIPHRLP
jgi:hypothetical protein